MSDFAKERMDICNSCPYNENGDCILCGCNLEIKTKDVAESCPLNPGAKWGPQSIEVKKEADSQALIPPRPPCKTCTRYGR